MSEAATPDPGYLPWRAVCGMAALVLTLSVLALAQSNHHEDDPNSNQVVSGGAFGYADLSGRQVLVPVETALARGMKGFRKAVAAPGRVVELTYAGAQRAGDGDTGRQTPERFADTAGAVFAAAEPVGPGGGRAGGHERNFWANGRCWPSRPCRARTALRPCVTPWPPGPDGRWPGARIWPRWPAAAGCPWPASRPGAGRSL